MDVIYVSDPALHPELNLTDLMKWLSLGLLL